MLPWLVLVNESSKICNITRLFLFIYSHICLYKKKTHPNFRPVYKRGDTKIDYCIGYTQCLRYTYHESSPSLVDQVLLSFFYNH